MCCISDIQYDRFQVKRDVRVNSHLKLLLSVSGVFRSGAPNDCLL